MQKIAAHRLQLDVLANWTLGKELSCECGTAAVMTCFDLV